MPAQQDLHSPRQVQDQVLLMAAVVQPEQAQEELERFPGRRCVAGSTGQQRCARDGLSPAPDGPAAPRDSQCFQRPFPAHGPCRRPGELAVDVDSAILLRIFSEFSLVYLDFPFSRWPIVRLAGRTCGAMCPRPPRPSCPRALGYLACKDTALGSATAVC
jgi:hypothetical protein